MAAAQKWKPLLVAVLALLLVVAAYIAPGSSGWIKDMEIIAMTWRYQVRGPQPPAKNTKVLGITENTRQAFVDIGVYYPFPREWHALALKRLADAGAQLVVMDILFDAGGSWDEASDEALRDAISYCKRRGCQVVLAAGIEEQIYGEGIVSRSLLTPAPVIMEAQPTLGMTNTQPKLSYRLVESVQQSLPLGESGEEVAYYSQPVAAFKHHCEASGRDFEAEMARAAPQEPLFFRINYCGPQEKFDGFVYSYERLFLEELNGGEMGKISPENAQELKNIFSGAAVFLGSRAKADNDYFSTPFGQMFGVETNAQAFDTLDRRRLVFGVPPVAVLILAALLTLLAWGLSLWRPIWKGALASGGIIVVIVLGNLALFVTLQLELALSVTLASFIVPFAGCTVYGAIAEEAAKKKIREQFSRYVSREVVDQIIADPSLADPGGVERTVALMFNDIRNYSTITERLAPHQIVEFLNLYLGDVTDIIRANGGFLDKYLGDGLLACFGGPVPTDDPAGDAINAALEMIRALHEKIRPKLEERGLTVFTVGIGIHVGKVVMGNIGSAERVNYTVVGDAVNVASRVEAQTKEFGWAVIVTREAKEASWQQFDFEFAGEHQVKGREQPVEMYRVVDPQAPELYRL
ncbi:MAG: adenylate/guanylate cyclase domain-containing protein [Planctomycetes bacterium]|nr:adenylate/guanylate cyclase domain-containing protein [Planctomycetota bacterium]